METATTPEGPFVSMTSDGGKQSKIEAPPALSPTPLQFPAESLADLQSFFSVVVSTASSAAATTTSSLNYSSPPTNTDFLKFSNNHLCNNFYCNNISPTSNIHNNNTNFASSTSATERLNQLLTLTMPSYANANANSRQMKAAKMILGAAPCQNCLAPNCDFCNGINDMDYAFLDQKPGMARKGGHHQKKGRRHAGEEMYQRQVSTAAYIVKKCVVDESGKQCGKKRRVRLLSDHMSDFNLSVPYSLNRKNRWEMANDAEEYARALAANNRDLEDGSVRVAVAESEFSMNHVAGERLKAYHVVGGESWYARSNRGSNVADLLAKAYKVEKGTDNADNSGGAAPMAQDRPYVSVEYMICKPQMKRYAARVFRNSFRNTWKEGGGKRSALELISGNSVGKLLSNTDKAKDQDAPAPLAMREPDENTKFSTTYSLADFLKESSPPPVFVKTPGSGGNKRSRSASSTEDLENQFNMVVDPADGVEAIEEDPKPELPAFVSTLLEETGNGKGSGTFFLMKANAGVLGVDSQSDWLQQSEALAAGVGKKSGFRWTNPAKAQFSIDLTTVLVGGENVRALKPLLVLSIAHTEGVWINDKKGRQQQKPGQLAILANSVYRCANLENTNALLGKRSASKQKSLKTLVEAIVEDFKPVHEDFGSGAMGEIHYKNEFNSHRLAHVVDITSIYQILEADAQRYAAWERQFVGPDELFHGEGLLTEVAVAAAETEAAVVTTTEKKDEGEAKREQLCVSNDNELDEDDGEEEDFELIDLSELDSGAVGETSTDEGEQKELVITPTSEEDGFDAGERCGACGEREPGQLLQLQSCGHRFCGGCLGKALNQQLSAKRFPVVCLSQKCGSEVPMGVLGQFLPLSLANNYALAHFALESNVTGICKCPHCKGVGCVQQTLTFGQVACGQCASVWCFGCGQRPHWPLNCAQANEWFKKFTAQYAKDQQKDEMDGGEKRSMANQFLAVCAQSFARRFDARQHAVKLSKAMGRLTDNKTKRQLMELRIICLHLLEFGSAWLFLTRGGAERPPAWNQLKSGLSALRQCLDGLENEALFTTSTDPQTLATTSKQLIEKVKAMEEMVEKLMTKFTSV